MRIMWQELRSVINSIIYIQSQKKGRHRNIWAGPGLDSQPQLPLPTQVKQDDLHTTLLSPAFDDSALCIATSIPPFKVQLPCLILRRFQPPLWESHALSLHHTAGMVHVPGSIPLCVGRSGLSRDSRGGIALFRGGRAAVAHGAFGHLCSWIVSHALQGLPSKDLSKRRPFSQRYNTLPGNSPQRRDTDVSD